MAVMDRNLSFRQNSGITSASICIVSQLVPESRDLIIAITQGKLTRTNQFIVARRAPRLLLYPAIGGGTVPASFTALHNTARQFGKDVSRRISRRTVYGS